MAYRSKVEDLEYNNLSGTRSPDELLMSSKSSDLKNSELEVLVANLRSQIENLKLRIKLEEDGEVLRSGPEPSKFSLNLIDRGGKK